MIAFLALAGIVLSGNVTNQTIAPQEITGVYRAIETEKDAKVDGLTVTGVTATVGRECYRVRGWNIHITGMHCRMSGVQVQPNLPEGLHVETGGNILIENSTFAHFQMKSAQNLYWNGDGIAAELPVAGLTIRGVSSHDNADGGFDIKPPVAMDNVSAWNNCRNYRLWSRSEIGSLYSGNTMHRGGVNVCAGVWVHGSPTRPKIHIQFLKVRLSRPGTIFLVQDGPADIVIDRCDIKAPVGSVLYRSEDKTSTASLGPGCSQ